MSHRDVNVALQQMLDYAREAVTLAEGKTRENLDTERLLDLALTRLLEIIGEAANRVPDEFQLEHPEIPLICRHSKMLLSLEVIDVPNLN